MNIRRFILITALFVAFSGAAFAQQAKLEVTALKASLYGAPNTSAQALTTVSRGEVYQVLSVADGWYLIQVPKYVGWINGSQVHYLVNGRFDRFGLPPPPEPGLTQYSTPVNWTEYRIPERKLSITLPKLPVIRNHADVCSEVDGKMYDAYGSGVVFEFAWFAKSKESIPKTCSTKTKFTKATFTKRLAELKKEHWDYEEFETIVSGLPAKVLRATSFPHVQKLRWLVWDRDHWMEIGVTYRPDNSIDVWRILGGLKRNSETGKDMGLGADATMGDPVADLAADGTLTTGIAVVTKPRPKYTEAARGASIQGTVLVRVTFLKNGGIGAVTVVKGLPLGLTEEAVNAARKIAFLPATTNGRPVTVIKQVEYTFSIY